MQFDLLLEGTSIAEFVDEVVVVGGLQDFNEANDVGGVFYFGQSLYFVDGEFLEFGAHLKLFDFDDFDGDKLTSLLIESLVDLTELSFPDHSL